MGSHEEPAGTGDRRSLLWLALATAVIFSPALGAGIFGDDATNLWHARHAAWSLESLGRSWSLAIRDLHDGPVPAWFPFDLRYFRPLTLAWFKLQIALFDARLWAFHLVGILLHAVVLVEAYVLALGLRCDRRLAWRASLRAAYDSYRGRAGGADAPPPEFYLVQPEPGEAHVFNEFRFRFPDRASFRGSFLAVMAPCDGVKAELAPDAVVLRTPGPPSSLARYAFRGMVGPLDPAAVLQPQECDLFRAVPVSARVDPTDGCPIIGAVRIEFDPARSSPARRFVFRGARLLQSPPGCEGAGERVAH